MEGAARSIAAVWSPDYLPAILTRALTPAMCERLIAIAESSGFARTRGGGCIFPSWTAHEVRAVTSGVRCSLVAWAVGDYFR